MNNEIIISLINFYKKNISKIELSLGVKLVLSSILCAFGGSSFLGFMSEYATYTYTTAYGFRLPTEGIPYLIITVKALSFIFLLCGGICFLLLYSFLNYTKERLLVLSKELRVLAPNCIKIANYLKSKKLINQKMATNLSRNRK